ncbi:helix-turn-helix transcriptional regulator [Catenulispora pinistramenti]|uniref:helix-turn-helix transcriptional regulator n=1 Tax=Catenulispora pinistramenti TaxID=2705254 RepID=UPI001BA46A61|nr:helix-turn-helix transcriptional regulator [Catenulispora pinistramenti]
MPDGIPVAIHTADPITRAGVIELLRAVPCAALVDRVAPGVVVLIAVGDADEGVLVGVDGLVPGAVPVVLATGRVRPGLRTAAARRGVAVAGGAGADFDDLARELREIIERGPVPPAAGSGRLAPREAAVLRLLAEGLSTAEVAVRLAYSERTVKNIVYDLTVRLDVRNRTHAVALAIREGLI